MTEDTGKRTYFAYDILYYLRQSPYLHLSRPKSAQRYLLQQVQLESQCYVSLSDFPKTQVESLQFFYETLRVLAVFDAHFLRDLCAEGGWRGVVLGGLLSLLSLDPACLDVLITLKVRYAPNLWATQCAIAQISGKEWPAEYASLQKPVEACRRILAEGSVRARPLRPALTEEDKALLKGDYETIGLAYDRGGLEAAKSLLPISKGRMIRLPYLDWLRAIGHVDS